jgi:hypothetical protein
MGVSNYRLSSFYFFVLASRPRVAIYLLVIAYLSETMLPREAWGTIALHQTCRAMSIIIDRCGHTNTEVS